MSLHRETMQKFEALLRDPRRALRDRNILAPLTLAQYQAWRRVAVNGEDPDALPSLVRGRWLLARTLMRDLQRTDEILAAVDPLVPRLTEQELIDLLTDTQLRVWASWAVGKRDEEWLGRNLIVNGRGGPKPMGESRARSYIYEVQRRLTPLLERLEEEVHFRVRLEARHCALREQPALPVLPPPPPPTPLQLLLAIAC